MLTAQLQNICNYVLTLDVGSGSLKNTVDTKQSIFINGNFARLLMVAYDLTENKRYLDEAIKWCDFFVCQQETIEDPKGGEVGFWYSGSRRRIYLADMGTAAVALARCIKYVDEGRRRRYIECLEKYSRFVMKGCRADPENKGRGDSPGWVIRVGLDAGAIGCGYYKNHVSRMPYTIATGTTGGGAFSAIYALTGKAEYAEVATKAVQWLMKVRLTTGEIPYILDNKIWYTWPFNTMTYSTEGILGVYYRIPDAELRKSIEKRMESSVRWLIKRQNKDGTFGELRSRDQQRSPEVISLLVWYCTCVNPDPAVLQAIKKNCSYLLDTEKAQKFGVKELVRTTGFVGLAMAEVIRPGITFRMEK